MILVITGSAYPLTAFIIFDSYTEQYAMEKCKLVFFLFLILFFTNCSKNKKGCWQAYNPQGYDEPGLIICDKTKAEAEAAYPQFWFYGSGESKYCWKVEIGGRTSYAWDIPMSMALRHMSENGAYVFTKVDCASFCTLEWHEKHKGKATNQFGPTRVITETILAADSCSKLTVGRVIVYRETNDSLITREVVKKFP